MGSFVAIVGLAAAADAANNTRGASLAALVLTGSGLSVAAFPWTRFVEADGNGLRYRNWLSTHALSWDQVASFDTRGILFPPTPYGGCLVRVWTKTGRSHALLATGGTGRLGIRVADAQLARLRLMQHEVWSRRPFHAT